MHTRKVLWEYAEGHALIRGRSQNPYAEGPREMTAFHSLDDLIDLEKHIRGGAQVGEGRWIFILRYAGRLGKTYAEGHVEG